MKSFILLLLSSFTCQLLLAQNVGINTTTPLGKLHIKGSADTSQLVIDAFSNQSNLKPLIRLRKSDGSDLLWLHSDAGSNSFLGLGAGRLNNAASGGLFNAFIGSSAGYNNSIGYNNTALGTSSLYSNSSASENTAIGNRALFTQSFDNGNTAWVSANTAVGYDALYANQPSSTGNGIHNTAIGHSALYNNNIGVENTAIGMESLYANVSGFQNTASGYRSLYFNTVGHSNTAIGGNALANNINGNYNTAIGKYALLNNTTGSLNTAVGGFALASQTFNNANTPWITGNTAIGYESLYFNNPTAATNGINNTAIGLYALRANITGYENTGVGVTALYSNTSGSLNNAVGRQALYFNTTGNSNNAMGIKALRTNNGDANTAFGNYALENNSTGSSNIAIGYNSLDYNTTGNFNTVIGTNAQNDGFTSNNNIIIGGYAHIAANVSNSTVVGYNAYTNTPNLALLGNPTTAYCGGYVGWTTYISDGRFKKNVQENVSGLDFINQLRPVTYTLDIVGLNKFQGADEYIKKMNRFLKDSGATRLIKEVESDNLFEKGIKQKENIVYSGFIAQEVEAAAKKSGYNFSGIKTPQNDKDNYGLTYSDFVVPLVKAVQEQQQIIEKLSKQIEAAKAEIPMQIGNQQKQIETLKQQNELLIKEIQLIKSKLK